VKFIESFKNYYWNYWKYWIFIPAVIALPNFIVFVIVALSIGGDALNGKIENGRYFLAYHGVYTEVSRNLFLYSKIHAISVIVTHSLFMFNGLMVYLEKRRNNKKIS
jgi:hypothetical protein